MKYKSFTIKNFRGIDNVTIDFTNNRILTLVGLNESGKTTIMEAIDLFYKLVKGKKINLELINTFRPKGIEFTGVVEINSEIQLEQNDLTRIKNYWKMGLNKKTELEIPDLIKFTYQFRFSLHSYMQTISNTVFLAKTTNSQEPLVVSNNLAWSNVIQNIKEHLIPEILYYDDFIFQIPDKVIFNKKQSTDSEIESNIDNDENNNIWKLVVNDIIQSVNSQFTFQEQVVDKWEKDEDAAINRLAKMEGILNEKITNRWGQLFGINRVNFKEIKLEPKYQDGQLSLSFKIKTESDKVFMVKERSKGFKWFFSFLLFTEFRKLRSNNILFLLDEPASNLHSSAQAKILEALNELSKDSYVLYSTHSHHLINPEWLKGAYICINEMLSHEVLSGNLDMVEGAKISSIKYYTYVGKGYGNDKISYFQPILDRLDYKPSSIEPIPNIILLEGKNDWYTLKYFEHILYNGTVNLNYYPGGGKDKLYEIIRIYLSWGKRFIILLDGDDGVKSKEKYLKEFGKYLEDKMYSLNDIFKKRIPIEELITTTDKKKIIDGIYGKGTFETLPERRIKENLNFGINELLYKKHFLSFNKTTSDNFRKLIDFLKTILG